MYITQPSLPHSPLTYAPVTLELPMICLRINSGADVHLAITSNQPKAYPKEPGDMLFSVTQDWLNQNVGTYMDGGIKKFGEWQDR